MSAPAPARPLEPCPFCKEPLAAGAVRCPRCDERLAGRPVPPPFRILALLERLAPLANLVAAGLTGVACGILLVALAGRLFAGPVPDLASAARSLRYLELVGTGIFLLLLAHILRR